LRLKFNLTRFLPKTLFGQVLITLIVNLLIFLSFGFMFIVDDHNKINSHLLSEYSAQRVAGIVSVLNDATPAERETLAQKLSVPPTTITLDTTWQQQAFDINEADGLLLENIQKNLNTQLKIQVLKIDALPENFINSLNFKNDTKFSIYHKNKNTPFYSRELFVQIKLHDNSTITIHHFLPDKVRELFLRFFTFAIMLTVVVISLASWSIYTLTKPLKNLAKAATELGTNINTPPLTEVGPEEIVLASKAFNSMQNSLKSHIETRTQALFAVSHDLRLPLTRLRLRIEDNLPAKLKEQIDQDIEEMEAMIGQTLDYLKAGHDTEAFIKLNISSLLDSICDNMEDLGANIERFGKINTPIIAQPQAINRCLSNIFENSRRYGGDKITLTLSDLVSHIKITIEDNGPGIPEKDLLNVFEPYYRLETSRSRHTGGTGLGLPIAKKIIEHHHGKVFLNSPPNKGLIVTILLPKNGHSQNNITMS
jgi:signal transduction histidine kinase